MSRILIIVLVFTSLNGRVILAYEKNSHSHNHSSTIAYELDSHDHMHDHDADSGDGCCHGACQAFAATFEADDFGLMIAAPQINDNSSSVFSYITDPLLRPPRA